MMQNTSLALAFGTFVLYATVGTYIFMAIEAGREIGRQKEILEKARWFLGNKTCLEKKELLSILDFIRNDIDLARFVLSHNNATSSADDTAADSYTNIMWDECGAASFVVSLLTTIGYGHIVPRTHEGQVACIVYALFGIPLTLAVLAGTGVKLCKLCDTCQQCRLNKDSRDGPCRRRLCHIVHGLVGLVILFIVPTTANMLIEKWTFLEAVYFVFISLTTIGFGDLVAGNPADRDNFNYTLPMKLYRWVNVCWTLMGLAYTSMLFTTIARCYLRSTGQLEKKVHGRLRLLLQRLRHKLRCRNCGRTASHAASGEKVVFTVPLSAFMDHEDCDLPDCGSVTDNISVKLVRFSCLHEGDPLCVHGVGHCTDAACTIGFADGVGHCLTDATCTPGSTDGVGHCTDGPCTPGSTDGVGH